MKNLLKINMGIDLLLFLAMVATSISGVVIRIIAPLRRVAEQVWVREAAAWFFKEWPRRTWALIHLWAGVVVMVLLVLHILLHWRVIDGFCSKYIQNKTLRAIFYVVLLVLLLLSVVPWVYAF